jgi:hypothetical protein
MQFSRFYLFRTSIVGNNGKISDFMLYVIDMKKSAGFDSKAIADTDEKRF